MTISNEKLVHVEDYEDFVGAEAVERVQVFGPGGGFIWAATHNIQYNVPPENIVAALDTARAVGQYPL